MKITYNVSGLVIVAEDGGASLLGTLKCDCPYCSQNDCYSNCEDQETEEGIEDRKSYNDMMDGIEALLLALAAEGVNIARPEFETAIQTAQETAANQY